MIETLLIVVVMILSVCLWRASKNEKKLGRLLIEEMQKTHETKRELSEVLQRYTASANNICERCVDPQDALSIQVADTGRCSVCHEIGECWDFDLIAMYKELEIPDQVIWEKLPRLLNPNINISKRHSLKDIFNELNALRMSDKQRLKERTDKLL